MSTEEQDLFGMTKVTFATIDRYFCRVRKAPQGSSRIQTGTYSFTLLFDGHPVSQLSNEAAAAVHPSSAWMLGQHLHSPSLHSTIIRCCQALLNSATGLQGASNAGQRHAATSCVSMSTLWHTCSSCQPAQARSIHHACSLAAARCHLMPGGGGRAATGGPGGLLAVTPSALQAATAPAPAHAFRGGGSSIMGPCLQDQQLLWLQSGSLRYCSAGRSASNQHLHSHARGISDTSATNTGSSGSSIYYMQATSAAGYHHLARQQPQQQKQQQQPQQQSSKQPPQHHGSSAAAHGMSSYELAAEKMSDREILATLAQHLWPKGGLWHSKQGFGQR